MLVNVSECRIGSRKKREVIRAELIKAEEEKQAALNDLTSVEASW
jgi:hypothetical protein